MLESNFIIHEKAYQYQWKGDCFLSIKSFYNGSAHYQVNQRAYKVNESNYLILNDCTKYDLTIDNSALTESFCVFFSPAFVAQKVSELNASEEQLLDFSFKKLDGIRLIEKNYTHTGKVSDLLRLGKRSEICKSNDIEKEEFYHQLLNAIFFRNNDSLQQAEKLKFKKKSTREEIYRRVFYAKDFIESYYSENLSLKQIADVALLSENHLLRTFRQIFGLSPFEYITHLKLAQAKQLILETDKSISEIAIQLGYSSISNFSYYFKTIFGQSPIALRKKVIYRK